MKTFVAAMALMLSVAAADAAGDRLDRARLLIFDRNWPQAVAELRRVLDDPKEPLRDEARFWLAHSLFQMGDGSEALLMIQALEREHPRSRWVLPGKSLRVDIAMRMGRPEMLWDIVIAPMPKPPMPPHLLAPPSPSPHAVARPHTPPAVAPTPPPAALTFTDVRIQALRGLLLREPERAVPVLREIVVEEIETPQARRALLVLGLSPHEKAREAVVHFAQTGPEPVKVVAVEQLGRWHTLTARSVLTTVYASSSARVKLEVLRALSDARADRDLIRIARTEKDAGLRDYAVAQLRLIDTPAARAYLRTLK